MRKISNNLQEAIGRVSTDSTMLELCSLDPQRAVDEMRLDMSPAEFEQLLAFVRILRSGSIRVQSSLAPVLRSADRTVQR
jgi:hypothetical protein